MNQRHPIAAPLDGFVQPPIDPASLPHTASGIVELDPDWLNVDAESFQFKSGGDAYGVTERLKGVDRFDPQLCGIVYVWEDMYGRLFIADGHQRLGLARRARDNGQNGDLVLPARIFRAVDGHSKKDIMLKAAHKNIAEGTGTPVDVARLIREYGELPTSIPKDSPNVKYGLALVDLGEETFAQVARGKITVEQGAGIAHVLTSHFGKLEKEPQAAAFERQTKRAQLEEAILRAIVETQPSNELETRLIATDVLRSGVLTRVKQGSLFGEEEISENLLKERAEILSTAIRLLKSDAETPNFMTKRRGAVQKYVKGGGWIDTELADNDRKNLLLRRELIKLGWHNADIGPLLKDSAEEFHKMKRQLVKQDPQMDYMIEQLNRSLNDQARELKLAKTRGEDAGDAQTSKIIMLRAACARQFLDAVTTQLENSEVAQVLRRSMDSSANRKPGGAKR